MVLPQAMAWVQYWFRVLSLKFCGKSNKNCGDISQLSPAFCMYAMTMMITMTMMRRMIRFFSTGPAYLGSGLTRPNSAPLSLSCRSAGAAVCNPSDQISNSILGQHQVPAIPLLLLLRHTGVQVSWDKEKRRSILQQNLYTCWWWN